MYNFKEKFIEFYDTFSVVSLLVSHCRINNEQIEHLESLFEHMQKKLDKLRKHV